MTGRAVLLRASLVLALLGMLVVPAGAQQTAEGRLEAARARINELAGQIDAAGDQVAARGQDLAVAQAQLDEVEEVVNDLAIQLEAQEGRVQAAAAELVRLQAEDAAVQALFDDRIAAIYKGAGARDLDLVLTATDVETVIGRTAVLGVVNSSDTATLEELAVSREQIRTQQERLAGEREFLEELKAEQAIVLAQVQEIRDSRYLAVVDAQAAQAELEREREDLEEDEKNLEAIIAAAQAAEAAGSAPPPVISAPSVGGYVWPLCGSVTSEYGRRWGRQHKGIDINDDRTTAIGAAKAGRVIFASYSGGYGNLMLIQHNDGVVTAYAHQASFAVGVGTNVATGQRIGTVGNTGNSTGSHLHFETRVGGTAVNPRRFLAGNGC